MSKTVPRAVVVRRSTDYEMLLSRHATRGQAAFFLQSRHEDIDQVESEHHQIRTIIDHLLGVIPQRWRRTQVARDDLHRFLFEPDDIVIAIGQDGLVANIAKYLRGQLVLGVNPLPMRFDGVLVNLHPECAAEIIDGIEHEHMPGVESRTMVEARLDDGQSIVALNEIFIGHRTHQSARYRIQNNDSEERQSSSGVIVSTGTGATGWSRSINLSRGSVLDLPTPTDSTLSFFVREAFPSVGTGTNITQGLCHREDTIQLISEMNQGGVIFGDGIEEDFLKFDWGQKVTIGIAAQHLNLAVVPR